MRFLILIACVLFFSENLFSQNKIELSILDSDSNLIQISKKKLFFADSLSVISYLKSYNQKQIDEGYISYSIDKIVIDSTFAKATTFNGEKYFWQKIETDSAESIFLKRNNVNLSRFEKKIFTQPTTKKMLSQVLLSYEKNGYPFTEVNLDKTTFQENTVSTYIKINKGNLYTIDSIKTSGKAKLSSSILYNLIDIHPNDIYNEQRIIQIEQKLKNVPYLRLSKPVEVQYFEEKAKILLEIEPQKANQFNGIIGFVPNNDITNKLLLTGELKLLLYNQLSIGERLNFNWQKIDQYSQKADANVSMPYFFNFPLGFEATIDLNKKDTSYLNVNSNTAIVYHISGESSVKVFYKNKTSNVLSETIQNITDFRTNLIGFGVNFQNLDYIFNPAKGINFSINIGAGSKQNNSETPENQTQIESISDIQFFKTIKGNLVFKLRNQSALLKLYNETNYDFYENEAFRIGGLKTLRGFDEESIFATSYSIFTAEIRYLFEENSAIYLFSDGGYVEKNLTTGFVSDTPLGIGAGLDFETRAGIFTISYALGKQLGNPFSVRSAKIHFGIISRF